MLQPEAEEKIKKLLLEVMGEEVSEPMQKIMLDFSERENLMKTLLFYKQCKLAELGEDSIEISLKIYSAFRYKQDELEEAYYAWVKFKELEPLFDDIEDNILLNRMKKRKDRLIGEAVNLLTQTTAIQQYISESEELTDKMLQKVKQEIGL